MRIISGGGPDKKTPHEKQPLDLAGAGAIDGELEVIFGCVSDVGHRAQEWFKKIPSRPRRNQKGLSSAPLRAKTAE